ncbi:hypothetical protein BDP81DRAFT_166002 [Colletotrichum phormii]|uniref:Uncharacterized protein n=1 Tax=Colletotrichum phormii TaxID=359342 RepID=A0AAI9ZYJ8_9PEZI|nr:uncharacterized protein BDP81DRAFT_166002 [Colletotrichum phormii]KAK1640609.1 hypothetical protein BDP81DRAFT_166002 [Colletotrichum phormii]
MSCLGRKREAYRLQVACFGGLPGSKLRRTPRQLYLTPLTWRLHRGRREDRRLLPGHRTGAVSIRLGRWGIRRRERQKEHWLPLVLFNWRRWFPSDQERKFARGGEGSSFALLCQVMPKLCCASFKVVSCVSCAQCAVRWSNERDHEGVVNGKLGEHCARTLVHDTPERVHNRRCHKPVVSSLELHASRCREARGARNFEE